MNSKQDIRPIYSELQGYLAQAPNDEHKATIGDEERAIWEQYNDTVKELNVLTGKDYDRFQLAPVTIPENGRQYAHVTVYRQKLGGLITRLHAEYFSDETPPFAEMPSTIISQSQNQNQSFHVQLLLEVNDLIHKGLSTTPEGSKEKTFLEKIKGALSSVKSVSELIALLFTTAQTSGITIEQLRNMFG